MGIIQRQSIKNSLLSYFGAAIGAISTFLIYPKAIEVHGLLYFLKVTALLCVPFANLGIQTLVVRFFPKFRDPENGHNGFLLFLLMGSAIFFLFFLIVVSIFWPDISELFMQGRQTGEDSIIPDFLWYVVPLTFLLVNINILIAYISNFHRIVVPAILYDLFMKIVAPILILLYFYEYITVNFVVNTFIIAHVIVIISLLMYLRSIRQFSLRWPTSKVTNAIKPMASYAIYSVFGSLGNLLATQLDTVMVAGLKTGFDTGVYANSLLITGAIAIPQRAIFSITAPLVADAWANNQMQQLKSLYQKTSINLLLAGTLLLILLLVNLEDLCALLPEKNSEVILSGQSIIFLIGLGIIIDMATSINGYIIYYSDYYRASFYMILLLGLSNILLNLYFIPKFGINGAALATLISLSTYNILKTIYVYLKFGIQPFNIKTVKLILMIGFITLLAWFSPQTESSIFNIFYRSIIIVAVFGIVTYFWKISEDGVALVDNSWKQIRKRFK